MTGGPAVHPGFLGGQAADAVDGQGGLLLGCQVGVSPALGVLQGGGVTASGFSPWPHIDAQSTLSEVLLAWLAAACCAASRSHPASRAGRAASTAEEAASVVVLANSGALTRT